MKDAWDDFEWDPTKAASNFAKHRVTFETAAEVFEDRAAVIEEDRSSRFEYRASITGMSVLGLLVVVYTERGENIVRIISARRANRHERREYAGSIS